MAKQRELPDPKEEDFLIEEKAPPATIPVTQMSNQQVMQIANQDLRRAETRRKNLIATYKNENKVPVYLSPMYRPYFGNVMSVSINGITIFFKVDGSTQYVPETFADEIASRRMRIDAILTRQNAMANVPQNLETSPGELKLF